MSGQIIFWQVASAYAFALIGGAIGALLRLAHKPPEGLALGSLLIGAGLQRPPALTWVGAVEATTLLGGAIGFFVLANASLFWLGLIMAHVGGGFLYLAVHAILGEMVKHGKMIVLTSFSAGVALIGILNICLRMFALG